MEDNDDLPGLSEEMEIYLGTGEDLVNDEDILRRFDLHVNTRFHFVSCAKCGYILTGSWENHVQKHYAKAGIKKWAPTEEEKLEVANLLGNTPTTTDFHHGMDPIQGIAIFEGFACHECDFCGKTIESLRTHASDHTSSNHLKCQFQRPSVLKKNYRVGLSSLLILLVFLSSIVYLLFVFIFPVIAVFSFSQVNVMVQNPPGAPLPAALGQLLIQRARGDAVQAAPPLPLVDDHDAAPWFRLTRWHEAVRAYPVEEVLQLFDERVDASDVNVVACLKDYFEKTSTMLHASQYNE